ncbi:phosphatase PAP2 family protein [Streptomyces sp. NPDC050560]|uniref:bifunctional glycosyltransferase 87/phosphatase PAP2 family protein n=1 Tax=Streptomyces sp. NPDC050560 TaxID=3365630 RepID=UPI0037AEE8F3
MNDGARGVQGVHSRPGRALAGPAAVQARLRLIRVGLWLVALAIAARQAAAVLSRPSGERLTDLETWTGPGGVLHMTGSLYDADRFTGTPFAGLVLKPLSRAAEDALGLGWTFGTLLLVAVLGWIAARALPKPVTRRTALLAAPVAISLLMLSLPVRNALYLGQASVIPVLLVLLGCFAVPGQRRAGVLIGVAAALQPTMLLFAALLWLTGRHRAALSGGVAFVVCTALTWVALPHDSWIYWVHHLAGTGLGANPSGLGNQSLHGALLRLGLDGAPEIAVFLALGAAVAVLGLRRALRYAEDGQLLLAVAITGCVAVAVSPTTWQHQLLWVLLAVIGRVGKRARDRYVWPVAVVLVLTLPAKALLPNMAVVFPLRDNVVLLAALAAACAVPFLPRSSPYFRAPIPTAYARPVPARWHRVPLLPFWRRVLNRPNLLLELLLIRVGYSAYAQVRLGVRGERAAAEDHGASVDSIEKFLHIDIEHWANQNVVKVGWLRDFFDFYYESFHFFVPLTILAVLYIRRPADFRWGRSALGFATVLALLGFWLFPLAPPRLMPGLHFVDTVHGVQDFSKPDYGTLTSVTNQYAAMPSLHFGWALWCGIMIAVLAPRWWMKALGLLHPLFTVSAIIATGNHWVLDAVGGATVIGIGFGLTHVLSGPRATLPLPAEAAEGPPTGDGAPPGRDAAPGGATAGDGTAPGEERPLAPVAADEKPREDGDGAAPDGGDPPAAGGLTPDRRPSLP